jgi:hypothetical protein
MHGRCLRALAALRDPGDGLSLPKIAVRVASKDMRWFYVTLALLLGAGPAFAQSSAKPGPATPAAKVIKRHHQGVHRRTATHHRSFRKAAEPATKPHHETRKAAAAIPAEKVPLPTSAPRAAAMKPASAKTAAPQKIAKAEADKADAIKTGSIPDSAAFSGISPAERLKIQSALYWHGDYAKAENGDDPAEAAIRSFQKRNKAKVTGVLTEDQRKELLAADERYRDEYGWRVVLDPATGIRIGLPTKLVPNVYDAPYGTRWSSPHGTVKVETFRIKGPNADLAKLFEEAKKNPADRKVETSVLHDDSFFISGMQGLKDFAVRAKLRDGEVRGFTILYDQMMETIVEPVMVAMASAFSPFPARPAPFAALSKRVEYGTGLIVSARGDILTARKVAHGCEVIVADGLGSAERVAEDERDGLALLRVYGKAKLPALALPRVAMKADAITLTGFPDPKEENGRKELVDFKARLSDGHAIVPREPVPLAGFAGAAALDGQGNFLGLMETRNYELASIQPSVPPVRLITAAAIRAFLERHHVAADGKLGNVRDAAIRIICVRK